MFTFLLVIILVGVSVAAMRTYTSAERATRAAERQSTRSELMAVPLDHARSWSELSPAGLEVFFPPASHSNALYELTFSGVLQSENRSCADAFYQTNSAGNFAYHLTWIFIDGYNHRNYEMVAEDRCTHRYTVHVRHFREGRLTVALERLPDWRGSLIVEATVLPPGTLTAKERRDEEHQRRVAKEAAQKTKTEEAEKFAAVIRSLVVKSEVHKNWESQEYQRRFAEAHAEELICSQSEIREEALQFLSQRKVLAYLQRHNPAVVRRFTGRLDALLLAEVISLDKLLAPKAEAALPPAPPPPPKKKFTAEEIRKIKIRKQQIHDQDAVELKMDKIATRLKIRERLAAMALDPDEREMLEQELFGEIDEGDDDGNARTI